MYVCWHVKISATFLLKLTCCLLHNPHFNMGPLHFSFFFFFFAAVSNFLGFCSVCACVTAGRFVLQNCLKSFSSFVEMICGKIIAIIPIYRQMGDSAECMDLCWYPLFLADTFSVFWKIACIMHHVACILKCWKCLVQRFA